MENNLKIIQSFVNENQENIINDWREIVLMESYWKEAENVRLLITRVKDLFEAEGFNCKIIEVGSNAPTLVGVLGDDKKTKPILFSGHLDTVFPKGSFDEDKFLIKKGNVYGPGVLDMKGGIIIALYVIKALKLINYDKTPIKIIFSGDEEGNRSGNNSAQVIEDEAKDCLFAFNLETGRIDNSLCIGRKGLMDLDIIINGKSSHAGNDFMSGVNAIEEAAHKIIKIQQITDIKAGTTVNCGVIKGGTVPNAIPDYCQLSVEIRYTSAQEENRVKTELERIVSEATVLGTSAHIIFKDMFSMFETSDDVLRMYNLVVKTAKEYGFKVPGQVYLGGCSDAAYISKAKTPVLCAFGVQGQWNHTKDEYAMIDSIYNRINLIAAVILNQDKF